MSYCFLSDSQNRDLRLNEQNRSMQIVDQIHADFSEIVSKWGIAPEFKNDKSGSRGYSYCRAVSLLELDIFVKRRQTHLRDLFNLIEDEDVPLSDKGWEEISEKSNLLLIEHFGQVKFEHNNLLKSKGLEPGHTHDLFSSIDENHTIKAVMREFELVASRLQRKQKRDKRNQRRQLVRDISSGGCGFLLGLFSQYILRLW